MRITAHFAKDWWETTKRIGKFIVFSCLQPRNVSLAGRYQREIAYAKSSTVWIKYLYKHFHKWCHLDSSSMSWGGEAKWSSGRCCLKASVELGLEEEDTKHRSDKSKPFSLHYIMYICDFAESVVCTTYALKYAVKILFLCATKAFDNVWFICFLELLDGCLGFVNELYRCVILGFLIG